MLTHGAYAMRDANLDREVYKAIIKHYSELAEIYGSYDPKARVKR